MGRSLTCNAIGEPGNEKCHNQGVEVVEDRYALGNDPGNDPQYRDDGSPRSDPRPGLLMNVSGASKYPEVDLLRCNVGVDDPSDHDLLPCQLEI